MKLRSKNKDIDQRAPRKTRVATYLDGVENVAPEVVDAAEQITCSLGLEQFGKRIENDPDISQFDKDLIAALLQEDIDEAMEIAKNREAKRPETLLTRNIRPLTMITVVAFTLLVILLDASPIDFEVSRPAFSYLEIISTTALGGYFVVRSFDKHSKNRNNRR